MRVRWEVRHPDEDYHVIKLWRDGRVYLKFALNNEEWQQLLTCMSIEMM